MSVLDMESRRQRRLLDAIKMASYAMDAAGDDPIYRYCPGSDTVELIDKEFIGNDRCDISGKHYRVTAQGHNADDLINAQRRFQNGARAVRVLVEPDKRWMRMEVFGRYTFLTPEQGASISFLLNEQAYYALHGNHKPLDWLTRFALWILFRRGSKLSMW